MVITEKVDFRDGVVEFDDFIHIDDQKPLDEQGDSLKEDLLQVYYGEYLVLDVGWYGPFNAIGVGRFGIKLIHNYDWRYPLYTEKTRSLKRLYAILQFAVDRIIPNHK